MKTAILITLICMVSLYAKTLVVLHDSSAVTSETITLGRIAEITGTHKNLLDTIVVATAAPAGHSRFLMKTAINLPQELRQSVEIKGPDRIKIHTLSQRIMFSELARQATLLLADSLVNTQSIKSEILFEYNRDAALNIPLGDYTIELGRIEKRQLRGRVVVPLVVVQSGGEKRTRVSLNAMVKTVAKVGVAVKDIARFDDFSPRDIEMKLLDITTLQGTPLYELPGEGEFRVVGAIRAGTVITNRHIAPKPVVEQGSDVRMMTGAGMVRVSIWGRARQSGGIGDIIAVENIESNRIVKAKVVSANLVEIVRGGTI